MAGKLPIQIFKEAGFDLNILGSKRVNCASERWRAAYEKNGILDLKDSVDNVSCKSFDELKREVDNYITYYNNYRYQWGLKKMTPVQYRNHLLCA